MRCRYCSNTGILGGKLNGSRMGPFEACPCSSDSVEIAEKVREGNQTREKLLGYEPLKTQSAGMEHATRDATACLRRVTDTTQTAGFQGQVR
jgi:hypothetical protein